MRRPAAVVLLALAVVFAVALAGCASTAQPIATFAREWDDGRTETLALYADGRVLMNHNGYLDRVTLAAADVSVLEAALPKVAPAADPAAFPRLTLTPAGGPSVVVDAASGTTGELFLSLLDHHRLP